MFESILPHDPEPATSRASGPGTRPGLSVILFTLEGYETLRKVMRHLREQTVRDELEILIVSPSDLGIVESERRGFFRVRVLKVDAIRSSAAARALAIQEAGAPVVVLAEDHSFPDREWAEALIQAHRQPWAAVAPAMVNGNPNTMISWADFLISYGHWHEPAAGVIPELPVHNSSYKRAALLEFGNDLEAMLERESNIHEALTVKGYKFYIEPEAKTNHVNASVASSAMRSRFLLGRVFGATRARRGRWSWLRRIVYIGGGPLIPIVELRRILGEIRRGRRRDLVPRIVPALLLLLVAHAAGEVTGYAFGPGDAAHRLEDFEVDRTRHLAKSDQQALAN